MKKRVIKIAALVVLFAAVLVISNVILNRGNDDQVVDMGDATLPRVSFMMGGQKINALFGYVDDMDIAAMRDTITPLESDGTLKMQIEKNDNQIREISYSVYSLDGTETYDKGTLKSAESEDVILKLGKSLGDKIQEAVLQVSLVIGEEKETRKVNFYTRIEKADDITASQCLTFAQDFHKPKADGTEGPVVRKVKTEKPSYKMKHSIDNPIEKQAIFENHHEPIIDLQTWERVQELRKQRKRPNRYDDVGLFSGLLFCADCGHVMYQQRYQTDKRKQDCYICGSYKKRTADCTAHFIRTDLLTAGVLDNLRKVTAYAQKHEARFVKLLIQQNEMGGKRKQAAATKQLEQVQSRIAELSRYIKRLYEDNVNGKISDERFMEMSADYEAEQRELKEKAAALQGELDKAQEATVNAEKFMNVVRKYLSIEELTHTLLREMVEKIVVYECEYDENEVRHQRIDIYYSFVGKIDLPEE